jgi:hypothetical protein
MKKMGMSGGQEYLPAYRQAGKVLDPISLPGLST